MKMRNVLSHLGVALSLCVLTITFLEARNPSMGFLTSGWSAAYIAAQCIVCIVLALLVVREPQFRRRGRGERGRHSAEKD